MDNSLLQALVAANVAGSIAMLVVMALRIPARRLFGARVAYGLWVLVPAAALAALLPAHAGTDIVALQTPLPLAQDAFTWTLRTVAPARNVDAPGLLVAIWAAGVLLFSGLAAIVQHRALARFGALVRDPGRPGVYRAANAEVGPALLGLFRPRIVTPADFEQRYDPREQALVLAHEQAHLAAGHLWANAAVTLIRALNWFNPLVHWAARQVRIDQELSCDAAVLEAFPTQRRTYAEAMVKTQFDGLAAPLGCQWPVRSASLLRARLEMLARAAPGRRRARAGAAGVAGLALTCAATAWAAPPPRLSFAAAPVVRLDLPRTPRLVSVDAQIANSAAAPSTPARAPILLAASSAPAPSPKDAALAAGDWRAAAQFGASAGDVVRALQARGQAADAVPEESVVTIGPDNQVEVVALKPLPPLPDDVAQARTANLSGTGFSFTTPRGAIVLYPASAPSFAPQTTRPAQPAGGPLNIAADHLTVDKASRTSRFEGRPAVSGDLSGVQVLVDGQPTTAAFDIATANARNFTAVEVRPDDPAYGRTSVNFLTRP